MPDFIRIGFNAPSIRAGLALVNKPEPAIRKKGLAALSGGADSSAMLAALSALADESFLLYAHHVNHGIRPPVFCAADEKTAADLCKKLNIPLTVTTIPSGKVEIYARQYGTGIEAAARHFRYQALREEARRLDADAIFTAHTADDRLETILMAFLRGSGPAGLGAMANPAMPDGSYPNNSPPVLRPLLSLNRSDALEYLRERGLSYCQDETNNDERFFRNRIRLRLVPFLDQYFLHWRKPVRRLGETQSITAAFLTEEAEKRLPWTNEPGTNESVKVSEDSHPEISGLNLSAENFFSQPEILREEALFQAMDKLAKNGGERKNPRRETLRSFIRSKDTASDLGQFRLENKNGRITIKKTEFPRITAGFSVLIKCPGIYKLKELTVTAFTQRVDTADIVFFGRFPLALCSSGSRTILAEDRQGRAAIIRDGSLVWKRKTSPEKGDFCFTINGGSFKNGSW